MGVNLAKEDIQDLLNNTSFNQNTLKRVHRRFSRLDK